MPEAAPVTTQTSPVNGGGLPALRSFACSRSQYSTSKMSLAVERLPAAERLGGAMISIVWR